MKKKILILFPYPFTEFHNYKFEIARLKKEYGIEVIINDLSHIVSNKHFNKAWKTRIESQSIKFKSLFSWFKYFNKIKKEKIFIYNYIPNNNFVSFVINLIIRFSNLPVIIYLPVDPFYYYEKKSTKFFLSRFLEHGFNLKIYWFGFKSFLFRSLIKIKKYNLAILFSNNFSKVKIDKIISDKVYKVNFNTHDYSNSLLHIQKNDENKKFEKNYIIYLDNGAPYFSADAHFKGEDIMKRGSGKTELHIKNYYEDLNNFFDKIEKHFKAQIVIIPHPKYKLETKEIKSLNPYFTNREVNNEYDSLAKLSNNSLFFISTYSTAISYAICHFKPIIHIYSSRFPHPKDDEEGIAKQSSNIGFKPIDICNFQEAEIKNQFNLNKFKYDYYKYNYLTPKDKTVETIPNYKIIGNFIEKKFSEIFH